MKYRVLFWLLMFAIFTITSILAGFIAGVLLSTSKAPIFVDKYYGSRTDNDFFGQSYKKTGEKLNKK